MDKIKERLMEKKKVNMASVQKEWPKLVDLLNAGEEIIVVDSSNPIAVISPYKREKISKLNSAILKRNAELQAKRQFENSIATEIWFG